MNRQKQLRQMGLFDARVPRYTSYPPATKFSDAVGPNQFTQWIRDIPKGAQISAYVHVPFCRKLCWFCACRTQGVRSDEPVRAYLASLKQEIALLRSILPDGVTLSRLHWGGGTPTLISARMIRDLAGEIQSVLPLAKDAEFSIEIDPNEIDDARLDALAMAGMNRASIGVQDFHPDIQQIIGRIQSYEVTRDTVTALRDRGIKSLNTDILFGLPDQTPSRIAQSVQMLLSLAPDRVSLYGYAHVPWMARRQSLIPTDALPTPEERLALFEAAQVLFKRDGYQEIGIDHFAKPDEGLAQAARTGHLRRNFQGYTDDTCDVLLGLGASSISRFPQGYAQNASATSAYQKAVRAGDFATVRGHAFTSDDRLRGRMIEALMCDFRINTAELVDQYGADPTQIAQIYQTALAAFPGMVAKTGDGFEILPQGRPLTRMVARSMDPYESAALGHTPAF
jgi:oxygen-independent coproporphyrinogen-3 oxidase